MTIYDEFRDLATALMTDDFGTPSSLYRVTGEYDPATDTRATHENMISCRGVLTKRKVATQNGVLISQLIATVTAQPETGDRITVGTGSPYTVETVEEIAPDGNPIIWIAVLK